MQQVSRDKSLKIPKQLEIVTDRMNTIEDAVAVKKALSSANDKKFNSKDILKEVENEDKELELVSKIPSSSNDLMVITIVKKLGAYVIAITEKSPKKFRAVFVNRMQNYLLFRYFRVSS